MKKDNKTQSLSDLLHSSIFADNIHNTKLNSVIKHSTIFSFWDNIVGSKFSKFTKPYSIKNNKLYISTKSSVIAQELNLYKSKILKKVNSYSYPLGIQINDLIFNYKNYVATNPITQQQQEDKPVWIKKEELEKIKISDDTQEEIKKNVNKIKCLNENQKEKLISNLINNEQAKIIRQKQDN